MKIEILSENGQSPRVVTTSHEKRTEDGRLEKTALEFNISTYTKTSDRSESVDPKRMFNELNTYLATRPQAEQDGIMSVYQRAHEVFQHQYELNALEKTLQKLVAELDSYIDLKAIREWVVFHSNIGIPASVHDTYADNEMQDYVDRTYIRKDYLDLVAMTVALRLMVPLWGEYITMTESVTGSNMKESVAFALLYHTKLVSSEPMERLRRYVHATIANSKENTTNAAAILTTLGSSSTPDWVTALAVVRRLAIGEIATTDENSSIVTNIFQYIGNTLRSLDRKFGKPFGGKVTDKSDVASGRGGSDEQSVSAPERYKVKQVVADGDIIVLSVYTEDVHGMVHRIDPTVDPAMIDQCLHCIRALEQEAIRRHQVTLVQWVLKNALPAHSGDSLDKPAILRAMAATQALLWHWQFYDLAALVTATPLPITGGFGYGTSDNRGRFPKEIIEQFQELYPHQRNGQGKQASSWRTSNAGAVAIDAFQDLISPFDWRLHCPQDLMVRTNRTENQRKLVVPGDVHNQLARMLIRIHQ